MMDTGHCDYMALTTNQLIKMADELNDYYFLIKINMHLYRPNVLERPKRPTTRLQYYTSYQETKCMLSSYLPTLHS